MLLRPAPQPARRSPSDGDRGFDLQQALVGPRLRVLAADCGRAIGILASPTSSRRSLSGDRGRGAPNDWMVRHDFLRSFEGCAEAVAGAAPQP